jgi:hypothetical protein
VAKPPPMAKPSFFFFLKKYDMAPKNPSITPHGFLTRSVKKPNKILNESIKWVYLLTIGTICDTFENLGAYLILMQITGTENIFNPYF